MSLRTRLANFLMGNKQADDTADTYRPGLSPLDMLNFGLVQPYIFQAYVYHENCSLLCDIDLTLIQETFRNGIGIEPKFTLRCRQCGHELQEKADKCPSCASDQLDEPLWAQQRYFEHLDGTSFLDKANYSGQTLQEVCENAAHHLHVADNAYLVAIKTYLFNDQGSVEESFVKEIISLDPRWVEKVFDKRGVPGGRHRLCLAHREALLGPETMRCPDCGKPTHDVTFKVITSNNGIAYFVDDEVCHLTEFYPHPLYGTPPCYKIRFEVETHMHLTGRVANYYKKGRPPGVIAVRTNNPKSVDETIMKVNLQLEKDPHAAPYFPVPTGPGEGSGEFMKWVPFMQDPCPDMMAVKDENRRAICAFFNIPPMVESDTAASGGLNDEGHQLTLLNRRTKREQTPFNNKAFPWMFKHFGITDLKLILNEPERNDEKADMELQLLEDQHAQNLQNMGYDVWIEGGKYKHSDKPKERPQPQVFQPSPPSSGQGVQGEPQTGDSSTSPQAPGDSLDSMLAEYPELSDKGDYSDKAHACQAGMHSHDDYAGGRCHPSTQVHEGGYTDRVIKGGSGKEPEKPLSSAGTKSQKKTPDEQPQHTEAVKTILDNRQSIGRPGKYIRKLGELGETVARSVLTEYKAHDNWNAANDLSDHANIEIKLLSPNSQGTPIMPNAHRRKVELKNETKKPWKFVFLRPTDEALEMYELDEPKDFMDKPDDVYVLKLDNFRRVGHFDQAGGFVRVGQ